MKGPKNRKGGKQLYSKRFENGSCLRLHVSSSNRILEAPEVPRNAIELCSKIMACYSEGMAKRFMKESIVKGPTDVGPCTMPPPYDPQTLNSILDRKMNSVKQVEKCEKDFLEKHMF